MNSFTIKESLSFGWERFKKHWSFLLPFSLVLTILYGGQSAIQKYGEGKGWGYGVLSFIISICSAYLSIGSIQVMLKIFNEEVFHVKDFFPSLEIFWKNILASIVYGLIVLGGLILLIVPGIVWWITYSFFSYIIIEKGVRPMESLKMSRKITVGERWHLLGFLLVVCAINIVGMILFGIGLLVSIPVTALATAYVYKKLSTKLEVTAQVEPSLPTAQEA